MFNYNIHQRQSFCKVLFVIFLKKYSTHQNSPCYFRRKRLIYMQCMSKEEPKATDTKAKSETKQSQAKTEEKKSDDKKTDTKKNDDKKSDDKKSEEKK